jgi:Ca2+/Na+ antiporter
MKYEQDFTFTFALFLQQQSFGKILGISNAIMGLTVIAWGNSVGDAVSNIIVSRKGHPQMAVSACIAAPLTSMYTEIKSNQKIKKKHT